MGRCQEIFVYLVKRELQSIRLNGGGGCCVYQSIEGCLELGAGFRGVKGLIRFAHGRAVGLVSEIQKRAVRRRVVWLVSRAQRRAVRLVDFAQGFAVSLVSSAQRRAMRLVS
jgi:hypothetical protein